MGGKRWVGIVLRILVPVRVRPEHRHHGIGTAALKGMRAECQRRGLLALRVEVGRDNANANRLYQRFGLASHSDGRHALVADLVVQGADA
jgi:GNAT superfamily N-acetyltransferase